MGNIQQHGFGGLLIDFDKPFYYPGDVVRGNIYLHMINPFETKGIELSVKTIEMSLVYDTVSKTVKTTEWSEALQKDVEIEKIEYERVEKKEKKTIYKLSSMMAVMNNNMLAMGQFAYPFYFALPANLPGSFEFYDTDCRAYVKYLVGAKLIPWNNHEKEISHKSILIVRQNPQFFQYPSQLSDTKNITTWCFFDKGTATLNISYPKNHFCFDELVQAICHLNNSRCKLNATSINMQLFQHLTIKGQKHHINRYFSRIVAENTFPAEYIAGQEYNKTLELRLMDTNNPVLRHLDKCKHVHLFRDPSMVAKLQATTTSAFIECKYVIRISTTYESCTCCSSTPSIDIPVIIYVPDIAPNYNAFQPTNWNPVMMPSYEFKFDQSNNNMNSIVNNNTNFNQGFSNLNMNN